MSRSAKSMRINGPCAVRGAIRVPGDKSISHRVAMLASVAGGDSSIQGFGSSADCQATLDCVRRLGVDIEHADGILVVKGRGLRGYRPAREPVRLDAGNSGSTMRMISGLLAGQRFVSEIDGDESLRRRPMGRIIEPLTLMGATIEARDQNFSPLRIRGAALKPIRYVSRVASAQVKTCVLFAGLYADGRTSFFEPAPSRDHTEVMLREFGAPLESSSDGPATELSIQGGFELTPVDYHVPGDVSSAAFFIAAATLLPDSRLAINNVNLNSTRTAFIDVLNRLGAKVICDNVRRVNGERVGDLEATSCALKAEQPSIVLAGSIIPNIIDEIPILAVAATQIEGRLEVRDARELRIKESDRVSTVANGIRAMGGQIEEFDDGFAIEGPQSLRGGRVETAGDHRIAMAFTVAGLMADGTTEIIGADSAAVSFPEFFELIAAVTKEGTLEHG
jgi:3-phosphoshikimate 1-carboxyvinyltransferase